MEVDFRIYNCTFFALLSNPFSPVVLIRRMMMEKGGKAAVWVDAWKFEKIFAVMKEIGAIESCSFGFLFDHFVKPRLRFRELKE
ncbi:hypothetical protein ACHQM5_010314 [Ranunculus cassubicifolius]